MSLHAEVWERHLGRAFLSLSFLAMLLCDIGGGMRLNHIFKTRYLPLLCLCWERVSPSTVNYHMYVCVCVCTCVCTAYISVQAPFFACFWNLFRPLSLEWVTWSLCSQSCESPAAGRVMVCWTDSLLAGDYVGAGVWEECVLVLSQTIELTVCSLWWWGEQCGLVKAISSL